MSLRLRVTNLAAAYLLKPWLARVDDLADLRTAFERGARLGRRLPPYTWSRDVWLADRLLAKAVSVRPTAARAPESALILYFHGGAFVAGSPDTHLAMMARLARESRVELVAPDYRKAPEHPFPAALTDAKRAWQALRARGNPAETIVLAGDSAGGNIALALLAELLAEGERPAGLVAFSPVTDLTFSGDSFRTNVKCDLVLPMARKAEILRYYLGSEDPSAPRASPLFADFPAPPPVFLQVSSTEALYDDSRRMAESLEGAGGTVVCDVWKGMPHVWTLMEGHMPEAREGLRRAGAFIRRCVDQADATGLTMR